VDNCRKHWTPSFIHKSQQGQVKAIDRKQLRDHHQDRWPGCYRATSCGASREPFGGTATPSTTTAIALVHGLRRA
jgi:hypothetical protein